MALYARSVFIVIARLFCWAASLTAQAAADPSGHWEGMIQGPGIELAVEIDLARTERGLAGTFGQPTQGVKGFPLSAVSTDGSVVRFVLKADAASSSFEGVLAPDRKSITGTVTRAGESASFTLTRTGDARIAAAPKNAPIGKELEGTWNGVLDVGERKMRLVLTMANRADGTAEGTMMSPDGSGVEIPIAITQKASNVKIEVPSVGVSVQAVLNAAETELTGTYTQAGNTLPLTFRRLP